MDEKINLKEMNFFKFFISFGNISNKTCKY